MILAKILVILFTFRVGFTSSFTSSGILHLSERGEAGKLFNFFRLGKPNDAEVDVVVIGGGVSGLTAAITAAETLKEKGENFKVALVEATSELGGRVQSEKTSDGFVLDKGFAVFIERYPKAKEILDYDRLELKPFLPGALIKLESQAELARVSDPLREPGIDVLLSALVAPIGSLLDKFNLIPLILNVRTKSIEELFEEEEIDTATALSERWRFSQEIISKFFKPFFEGIFLAPLSEQSSRMFSFVFKMFSEGAATLPHGGMGVISKQLVDKAKGLGVDIQTEMPVSSVRRKGNEVDYMYSVELEGQKTQITSPCVIIATDGQSAQGLLSNLDGFQGLKGAPKQSNRSVGCLYYTFKGDAPIQEPILILNGVSNDTSGNAPNPVNNVIFPSVVSKGYAPEGYSLCSVTVLEKAMNAYDLTELDLAVRKQLANWFPDKESDILTEWQLKKTYLVSKMTLIYALQVSDVELI